MSTWCETRPIFLVPGDNFLVAGIASTRVDRYQINAADDTTAYTLLATTAPAARIVGGITLDAPVKLNITKQKTFGRFLGTATYTHPQVDSRTGADLKDTTVERLSFDFSSGSRFFSQAISQNRYPNSGSNEARDVGLYLNVNVDGSVDGLDWGEPGDTFQVEKIYPQATVTNAWVKARYKQRLTKNNGTFRSLDAGDCLFLGFSGHQQSNGDFPITWKFGVQIGETGVTNIGGLNLEDTINISGFDYAWTMSRPQAETASGNEVAGVTTPKVIGAYVAELFQSSDFSQFGILT